MKTSTAGREAVARREGCVLKAYQDSVGVWTIGVGHTSAAGAPKVVKGMRITATEADEILSRDLALFESAVNKAVAVPLNQNEFDALVSLAFNIGSNAFRKSTLVRKLNAGDRQGAADQFLVWNKAGGKVLKGLVNRRHDERRQFLKRVEWKPHPADAAPDQYAAQTGTYRKIGEPVAIDAAIVITPAPTSPPADPAPQVSAVHKGFLALILSFFSLFRKGA